MQVKNLRNFEDISQKTSTFLLNFNTKPIFENFLISNKEAPSFLESKNENEKKLFRPNYELSINSY